MQEIAIGGLGLSVIIILLVQFIKSLGMNNRWAPALALVFGIPLAVLYSIATQPLTLENILTAGVQGLISAAVAIGFWSGVKNTLGR